MFLCFCFLARAVILGLLARASRLQLWCSRLVHLRSCWRLSRLSWWVVRCSLLHLSSAIDLHCEFSFVLVACLVPHSLPMQIYARGHIVSCACLILRNVYPFFLILFVAFSPLSLLLGCYCPSLALVLSFCVQLNSFSHAISDPHWRLSSGG